LAVFNLDSSFRIPSSSVFVGLDLTSPFLLRLKPSNNKVSGKLFRQDSGVGEKKVNFEQIAIFVSMAGPLEFAQEEANNVTV
jgi:hypothetical protein